MSSRADREKHENREPLTGRKESGLSRRVKALGSSSSFFLGQRGAQFSGSGLSASHVLTSPALPLDLPARPTPTLSAAFPSALNPRWDLEWAGRTTIVGSPGPPAPGSTRAHVFP